MHIGMVSATYDAGVVNGVLRMVDLYRQQLEARGHQVTVFALGKERTLDADSGIVRSPGLPLGDFGYYAGIGYTPEAQRLLATMDIVHCHHLFMSLELAHRYANAPIVYTNHTRYDLYTISYTHLPQSAVDAIMHYAWPHFTDMADHVIAPSAGMEQVMLGFGVRAPISVIDNGIDLRPFLEPSAPLHKIDLGLPEASVLCVYCGRLSAEKEVEKLVRLFAAAAAQRHDLYLLLIGKGPLEAELRQIVTNMGLADRVRFAGPLPYHEVGNYLAAADIFVTASTSEVHPLTVIEAMAAHLPVIAVSSPGIVETIDSSVTGLLVPVADKPFIDALIMLTADAELRRTMGAAAREAGKRYDINRTVDQTLELYRQLLERRPDQQRKEPHSRWKRRTAAWELRLSGLSQALQIDWSKSHQEPGS